MAEIELSLPGLIRISNEANDTVCLEIATTVAQKVPGSSIKVTRRPSRNRWARCTVSVPFRDEVRAGVLAQALGQA